ncbi:Hypothetical protein R9X50_00123300 [Acrodontium crateriforme]|uniref:Uncharacterized protein n=1 Tax=Acrodontium crateriforme TaxID=150365 RepID=A0AAQ3LYQ8_9PEZI|nr:Hypothetical protein R9X50_00123300 [Acrodontium crateriforme]
MKLVLPDLPVLPAPLKSSLFINSTMTMAINSRRIDNFDGDEESYIAFLEDEILRLRRYCKCSARLQSGVDAPALLPPLKSLQLHTMNPIPAQTAASKTGWQTGHTRNSGDFSEEEEEDLIFQYKADGLTWPQMAKYFDINDESHVTMRIHQR